MRSWSQSCGVPRRPTWSSVNICVSRASDGMEPRVMRPDAIDDMDCPLGRETSIGLWFLLMEVNNVDCDEGR